MSCQSSAPRAPAYAVPPAPPPGVGTDASSTVENYGAPQVPRQLGSAALFLPGATGQRQVNFATVNGQAVLDGDIVLGPATALLYRYGIPWQSTLEKKGAVAVASRNYLWPSGEIPYVIDPSAEDKRQTILNGIRGFDGTSIKVRPRTSADRDYVVFRRVGEGCWSYLGRQGGAQDVDVTSCLSGNITHELMHAAGFYHEQSRGDRDEFITIVWNEITPDMVSNFDK
ncbi:MAG: M12 family metallopeptidase, partial [Polyangiaceae bacterium]